MRFGRRQSCLQLLTPYARNGQVSGITVVIKVGTSSLLRADKNCIHLSQVSIRTQRREMLSVAILTRPPSFAR